MWHPKQLLKEPVINALLLGGLDPLYVEFLGWMSGTASALNKSHNPVKAAHTILARIGDTESGTDKMWRKFKLRKVETIAPSDADTHEQADQELVALKGVISEHIEMARVTAHGYQDFTKGGVSNGDEPEEEAAAAAVAGEEEDYE